MIRPMPNLIRRQKQSATVASRDYVQSFVKGLDVIRAFDTGHTDMTLSEVATRANLTRAAARRLLLTLVEERYATTDGKHFRLAPRTLDLGFAYLSSSDIWESTQTVLTDVTRQIGESCSASGLDGHEIVYVARVAASRIMAVDLRVGSRLPAFHTSMGRVLLAHLPEVELDKLMAGRRFEKFTAKTVTDPVKIRHILKKTRSQGWCLANQELELGLMSIAVPLRDRLGRVAASINVSSHAGRATPQDMMDSMLPVLQSAAAQIESLQMRRV